MVKKVKDNPAEQAGKMPVKPKEVLVSEKGCTMFGANMINIFLLGTGISNIKNINSEKGKKS